MLKKRQDLSYDVQSYDRDIIEQWRVDYSCLLSSLTLVEIGISFAPLLCL